MHKRNLFALSSLVSLSIGVSFNSSPAHAWGHEGHQKLAEVATTLTTAGHTFWTNNTANVGILTNVPDVVWKSLPTAAQEKPTHFFQPDSYINDPSQFNLFPRDYSKAVAQYTAAALNQTGTATWRAKQLYDLAVASFKSGDMVQGLQYAGTMCHYIGDLSQPLHVAKNYDGQETGDKGIHAFFETANIQASDASQLVADITAGGSALQNDSTFRSQSSGSILDAVFNEVNRSYSLKDTVIGNDLKLGRSGAGSSTQLALAKSRMSDGAATLAIVLSKLWADAGNPTSTAQVTIDSKPAWVSPDYAGSVKGMLMATQMVVEDDCQ